MKIIIIGANGTIGKAVTKKLIRTEHEIIKVGRTTGDFQVDIESPESISSFYKKIGSFDALINASGEVAFAPLEKLSKADWDKSFRSKLLGQIQLVQLGLPYIRDRGSFTLISGVLADEPIKAGVAASTVNKALEGFVMAAACELPRGLRINLISPTLLTESEKTYEGFFPGFVSVPGEKVAEAYAKSALGIQTGKVIKVY